MNSGRRAFASLRAGAVSATPGYFADWFPTLCDAIGVEKPAGLDGESLWPVLTGGATPKQRKPLVWLFAEYGGQVAVRVGDFKLVRQNLKTSAPAPDPDSRRDDRVGCEEVAEGAPLCRRVLLGCVHFHTNHLEPLIFANIHDQGRIECVRASPNRRSANTTIGI